MGMLFLSLVGLAFVFTIHANTWWRGISSEERRNIIEDDHIDGDW